jgi:hypothetical protein
MPRRRGTSSALAGGPLRREQRPESTTEGRSFWNDCEQRSTYSVVCFGLASPMASGDSLHDVPKRGAPTTPICHLKTVTRRQVRPASLVSKRALSDLLR